MSVPGLVQRHPRLAVVSSLILIGLLCGATMAWLSKRERGREVRESVRVDKESLRTIAAALQAYAIDWNCSALDLEHLTRPYPLAQPIQVRGRSIRQFGPFLEKIPRSQFGREIRHSILNDPGGGFFYLLWTPGPDRVFDITQTSELSEAMNWMHRTGRVAPWLASRVYDPSNGTLSPGDIIRLESAWTTGPPLR